VELRRIQAWRRIAGVLIRRAAVAAVLILDLLAPSLVLRADEVIR
jgi:hypothetical protein